MNTIQGRVAALEYNLANGGSLAGIAGADHSGYVGSLAIAGAQFAAPNYSNAPNLLGGSAFEPADATKMLQDYVKAKLLPYKYPREVKFLDELPKTGTGKIDRQALLKA